MAVTFNDYLKALQEPVLTPCIRMEWLNADGTVAYETVSYTHLTLPTTSRV